MTLFRSMLVALSIASLIANTGCNKKDTGGKKGEGNPESPSLLQVHGPKVAGERLWERYYDFDGTRHYLPDTTFGIKILSDSTIKIDIYGAELEFGAREFSGAFYDSTQKLCYYAGYPAASAAILSYYYHTDRIEFTYWYGGHNNKYNYFFRSK